MAKILYRIGGFAARKAWVIISIWIVILLALGGAFAAFKGDLSSNVTIPGTKSQQLQDQLSDKFDLNANAGTGQAVVKNPDGKAITADQQKALASALQKVGKEDGVDSTTDPFAQQKQLDDGKNQLNQAKPQIDAGQKQLDDAQKQIDDARSKLPPNAPAQATQEIDAKQGELDKKKDEFNTKKTEYEQNKSKMDMSSGYSSISDDGSTTIAQISFKNDINSVSPDTLSKVRSDLSDADLKGLDIQFDQNLEGQPMPGGVGEAAGIVVAFVILMIMMGTFIAAGLPILMALVGVGSAMLATYALSGAVEMNSATPTLGMMLGLAVGIDYSLFIINRHRNNLVRGMDMKTSIALATGTSGNAVVFAGATVIIALLALNIAGIPFLAVMGNVAAMAVFLAVLVAVTMTPAMLGLVGRRIMTKKRWKTIQRRAELREKAEQEDLVNSGELQDRAHRANLEHESTPHGWLKFVTKHPVITTIASVAILAIVALPMTQMRLGLPDATSSSPDSGAYKSYKTIEQAFGAGRNSTMVTAADLPQGTTADQAKALQIEVGQELQKQDDVKTVVPAAISKDNSMLMYQIVPDGGPNDESTTQLVNNLRDLKVHTQEGDVSFGVAGQSAMNIDISENLFEVLPLYLAVVIGLSLLVLILVFRSILVPITATVGFLFSLLAAFGATVAVFQWGWLGQLFGVNEPGPILSFLPILAVGILFGLAMDYQVFLVSAMREAYSDGRGGKKSVIIGYNHSSKVVVAAALIMSGVFLGFVFSGQAMIASIGFGLTAGVLFDAFVVRLTLIPAVMYLLGEKSWWLPRWIDKILPNVDVEGSSLEQE
ncbi:MMPL family transporter [Kocuria sp. HSID16901]|uniref:MMPL family transporter n=1 Tax=Kocuria sp. HSID16901 TaxID=2419505 RepID=UPI0006613788|nr:MMPL family transporter [Kocuria sp. HSID16901]RUQ23331.1 MMPL family transporter [Kocuria sp. HSID16901]